MRQKCTLELSSGHSFQGELIGAPLESSGEMVFTTGMVGYSEALTDPSYFGQILAFTYPLIGNYGIPPLPSKLTDDIPVGFESSKVNVAAAIVTIDSEEAFHWNSFQSLSDWLAEQAVPGISGIDTRHLVHIIRSTPNLKGRIIPERPEGHRTLGPFDCLEKGNYFDPGEHNILPAVSTEQPVKLGSGKYKIAAIDCGIKWNIIRQLLKYDTQVELIPWNADLSKVDCDGWLLSNGPGNPQNTGDLVSNVKKILEEEKPVLGICLGHQILSLAAGLETERMDYGHRSHNQPVYLMGTRKGFITSQNHGYVVKETSIPEDWNVWFRNANDQTVEGIRHADKPFLSVQFHPEAAGGPRDTNWVMNEFFEKVERYASTS